MRGVVPALFACILLASPAPAQTTASGGASADAPFDPVAATRNLLADRRVPGLRSLQIGNVDEAGATLLLVDVTAEFVLEPPSISGAAEGSVIVAMTAPMVLVDGLSLDGERYLAEAIRVPSAQLLLTVAGADEGVALPLGRLAVEAPSWPAAPKTGEGNAPMLAAVEPAMRWLSAMAADAVTVDWPDGLATDAASLAEGAPNDLPRAIAEGIADGAVEQLTVLVPTAATRPAPLVAKGIDLGALADAVFATSGPATPILEEARLTDLAYDVGGERTEVEEVVVRGLSMAPAAPSLATRIDAMLSIAAAGRTPDAAVVLSAVAPLWDGFALDEFAVRGVTGSGTTEDGGPVRSALGSAAINNLTMTGPISASVEGFETSVGPLTLSLGSAGLDGLSLPTAEALAEAVERVARFEAAEDEAPPRSPAEMQARLADMLAPLSALPKLTRVSLRDGAIREGEFGLTLSRYDLVMDGHVGRLPAQVAQESAYEVRLKAGPNEGIQQLLAVLGTDTLRVHDRTTFRWFPDGRVRLRSATRVPGLGAYEFTLAFAGVPRRVLEEPQRVLEALALATLERASLTASDEGGLAMAMTAFEEARGLPWASGRDTALDLLRTEVVDRGFLPPEALAAAAAFLDTGGRITLRAAPPRPVPLFQLGSLALAPTALPRLLNVELVHQD
ncbi:hypothetical protein [Acuticoccus sp.]|uniref:hypothetical protein n=1 Tax=Acuticoccus sp. TaxID=1904378 RepID=UPI003B51D64B